MSECRICKGKGRIYVPSGEDDVDIEMCEECNGTGKEEVMGANREGMDYDKLFKPLSLRDLFKVRDALAMLEDYDLPVTDWLHWTEKEIEIRQQEQEVDLAKVGLKKEDLTCIKRSWELMDMVFRALDPRKCTRCGCEDSPMIKGICEKCRYANEDLRPGGEEHE